IAPMFLISPILTVAVASSLQTAAPEFSLAIWHGFNLPLMMSFIALVLGVAVYSMRHRLFAWHDRCLHGLDGKAVFDWVLWKIIRLSKKITDAFDQT
ncbi:MAG TPA: monovalent cation/H+ antiporter subunit A, partial [Methylophaga sp.]|nr:monovalent cation/H+ antiporter subunit A [Methylophaga sp.]